MAEKVSGMKYFGKTVYSGITMGKVLVLRSNPEPIRRAKIEDAEHEINRVHPVSYTLLRANETP